MSHDRTADDRPLRLREAARLLGLSYERLRVLVNQGRLKTEHVAGVGRVVRPAELERFRSLPRRVGRRRKPEGALRPPRRGLVRGIENLLDRVTARAGYRFSKHQRRNFVRFGLLPARRDFPRGERGRRAWLACQCRRLAHIARLRDAHIIDVGDLLVALKFDGYRVRHDFLTVTMLCYLGPWAWILGTWREDEAAAFAVEAAKRPSPYPGVHDMTPEQRTDVYEALLRIASGGAFTCADMQRITEGVGLPYDLLPQRGDEAQEPDLSWSGLFSVGQANTEKVVASVQSAVTKREDGDYEFRPFCTAQEMDRAWAAARIALAPAWQVITHLSVPRRVLMATIVRAVMDCLIIMREQSEDAFLPIEQIMSEMRRLMERHPTEVAEMLKSHPELGQLLGSERITKTDTPGGGGTSA